MKTYKTQKEIEKDIKNNELFIDGDVKFECSFVIEASLKINGHIFAHAWNINARDINAWNINAGDINAGDINAWNINARDINAWNINAGDINARDINAWNINAGNINAWDILYYAFCCVYEGIKCLSIKAKREKYSEPICLDGKLEIKDKEVMELTLEQIAEKFGKDVNSIKIKK